MTRRSLRRHVRPEIKAFAIKLRNRMTPAEAALWQYLKGDALGCRFRAQVVLRGFIVDFYCAKHKLAIEIDGSVHDNRKEQDARRQKVIEDLGFKVLRFTNQQTLKSTENVLSAIRDSMGKMGS